MSTAETDGRRHPLLDTKTYLPSTDCAIASGRLPDCTWWPAGAIFQPLGSSVTPLPSGPGRCDAGTSPDVKGIAPNTPTISTAMRRDSLRMSVLARGSLATACNILATRVEAARPFRHT